MEKYTLPVVIEKDEDGYFAMCPTLQGCYSQGDTYEEALSDVKSPIRFHIETFGEEVLDLDPPIIEAFIAEARV